MQKQIRYELLRESFVHPNVPLEHELVGGAILDSIKKAPARATSKVSFIPPWWDFISQDNIILAWGDVKTYPSGGEGRVYLVERQVVEPRFVVRCTVLDAVDYPLKEESFAVAFNLSRSEALDRIETLRKEYPDYFFDIYPQDLWGS